MIKGVIKWFSAAKGYGFIEPDHLNDNQDVFIHFSVIEMEGFRTLKAGQIVLYDLECGPKGVLAKRVIPVAVMEETEEELPESKSVDNLCLETVEE